MGGLRCAFACHLAPERTAARDRADGGRTAAEGRSASLSICQRQPRASDNERSRDKSAEFRCCRESRLVSLSSSWDSQRTGPLKGAVIGRSRWLHPDPRRCQVLASSRDGRSQAQDLRPKSLRASVVCNKSLASPEGSLYVRYNMRSASSTSHVPPTRPPLLMNSAT